MHWWGLWANALPAQSKVRVVTKRGEQYFALVAMSEFERAAYAAEAEHRGIKKGRADADRRWPDSSLGKG